MVILIDGSYGEGGGQIVRTSVALSSITRIPVKIINIRANRRPKGLKMQHLHAINLLSKISNAKVFGNYLKSEELEFHPKTLSGGYYEENIGTAGSITLLLQAVLLPSLFVDDKAELKIVGGTDVKFSPSIDYFREVIVPNIERFAREIKVEVLRRGFYPRGGGIVRINIDPEYRRDDFREFKDFLEYLREAVNSYSLIDGEIEEIKIISVASKDLKERKVAERQLQSAKEVLERLRVKFKSKIEYVRSLSTGSVITIVGKGDDFVFGADALGEKRKRAEEVGKEAASKFLKTLESKSLVDEHLADNLIPYLALAGGKMKYPYMTGHLATNIWVVQKFLGKDSLKVYEDRKIIEG